MSYTPTVWKSGDVVSSLKLNKLENGVKAAADGLDEVKSAVDDIATTSGSKFGAWEQGNVYRSGSTVVIVNNITTRCRILPKEKNPYIKRIIAKSGYKFVWIACTLSGTTYTPIDNDANWQTEVDLSNYSSDYIIILAVAKENANADITPEEAEANIFYTTNLTDSFFPNSGMYVVGADLQKKYVKKTYLGELVGRQSFCKYNGNYYSYESGTITVQNSDFETINSKSLSAGHGNAMQLGSNGKAYLSSGPSNYDNVVYVVDLATLEIESTIALPKLGYSTCAVDDVKKIIYMFYRASSSAAVGTYDFIVYDYENQETIRTSKTRPFAAMQACDCYNDRIIALNGGGSPTYPNGCRVYDTFGNVLADYHLSELSAVELEGVFVDRDTGDLFLTTLSTKAPLYKISLYNN